MLLPIGIGQVSIRTGIAAVNHHVVAYIQAAVGNTAYIIAHGSLEEDHVAGFGILRIDRIAVSVQACCAHMPDVVHASGSEQPADETGAVKGCGRIIAAPYIPFKYCLQICSFFNAKLKAVLFSTPKHSNITKIIPKKFPNNWLIIDTS